MITHNLLVHNLNVDVLQFTVKIIKLHYFSDKEVAITMRNFCIGYMDHIIINIEVQLQNKNKVFPSQVKKYNYN